MPAPSDDRSATFRDILGVREFRYLFLAYLLSLIGDQLAKVALSILVFQRTQSALLSAVTFAVSYLPWLIGGPLLSVYADRLPRRQVLIGCDLVRLVLVGSLAVPGIPLVFLVVILFVASLLTPPFEAARSATMPEVLEGDRYAVATAVSNMTAQLSQVIGFLAGGALVMLVGARGSLLLDAGTFALSALLIAVGVAPRPVPMGDGPRRSLWDDAGDGIAVIFGNPRTRLLILILWVSSAFAYGPEGLAAPFAVELDGRAPAVGMLLAASPLGLILGGVVVGRFIRPSNRERLLVPLALLSVLALIPVAAVPALPGVLLLYFLSGVGFSFLVPLNVLVVRMVPGALRGRAFGVVSTGLQAVQGLSIVGVGLAAEFWPPSAVVTVCGALGGLSVGVLARRLSQHEARSTRG